MRKTKTVYSFTDDGIFNGTDVAFESWELNNVYLLPTNTTETSLPDFNPLTHEAVWLDATWHVRERNQEQNFKNLENTNTYLAPEIDWVSIREVRKLKLDASDWTIMPDVNLKNKEAWITYRQALRDIPQIYQDPTTIIWPVAP